MARREETITQLQTKLSCGEEELAALQEKLHEVEEEKEQHCKLQKIESQKEQVVGERTSLLEMNNALSAQVSDSLANIHELQCREVELCKEVALLSGFLEAS